MKNALYAVIVFATIVAGCAGGTTLFQPPAHAQATKHRADTLAPGETYAQLIETTSGLVAYYRLDEASGTTFHDSSGNGHDGTSSGAISYSQPGALAGDPDTAIGLLIEGGQPGAVISTLTTLAQYSFEAWIRFNVSSSAGDFEAMDGQAMYTYYGSICFTGLCSPSGAYDDNKYHHVVGTYDGATKLLYVDGIQVASATASAGISTATLALGKTPSDGCPCYGGDIDEAAIYGVSLSAAQVSLHFAAGTGTASASPTPTPLPSGFVDETGTVSQVDVYGTTPPTSQMVRISPNGSPYPTIDCYNTSASYFGVGEQVSCIGQYHYFFRSQWVDATVPGASLTCTANCPSPPPSPSPSPTPLPSLTPVPSPTPTPTSTPTPQPSSSPQPSPTAFPRTFDHVEVVILENKPASDVIGNPNAPYINSILASGAYLSNYSAVQHPSLPNYLALYSGSTQGQNGDDCPASNPAEPFSGPTIESELLAAGMAANTFAEEIPAPGSTACSGGTIDPDGFPEYQGHHNPPRYFGAESSIELGYTNGSPPSSFPQVSYIIPDNCDNGHDSCGGNALGHSDAWLQGNVPALEAYNNVNNGLLVITWDEGNSSDNMVLTLLVGPMVAPGTYISAYNHYSLLRTITDNFGISALNGAGPITGVFETRSVAKLRSTSRLRN